MPYLHRASLGTAAFIAASVLIGVAAAPAAEKTLAIGITLPLTGADAGLAARIKYGYEMALAEANEAGGVAGYKLEAIVLDDSTTIAGQYDPAQAASNARRLSSDPRVVANFGPQNSGEGKAMAPILSEGDLATITPSSTNPDITDPKFAAQYRPQGKPIYFRTVTTDAYQGPNMANFMKATLHVTSVFVLDDSGAYGVGIADAFEGQARKIGINVVGRDRLNPQEADYTTILTKIKGLGPDALYYGGVRLAGTKLVKQAYVIVPKMIKAGGDGMHGPDLLTGAGFPTVEGWYATIASPHLTDDTRLADWAASFQKRFGTQPDDYSITAYDGAEVVIDAIGRVAGSGGTVDRHSVRDAIEKTHLATLQGEVGFDANGDILSKVVSVFQIRHDAKYPDDDIVHQFAYVGVAPAE